MQRKEIRNKNLYELHRGINKNRKEWEIEHQLVIENKCCENKNTNGIYYFSTFKMGLFHVKFLILIFDR
jgi:hypothetical protein